MFVVDCFSSETLAPLGEFKIFKITSKCEICEYNLYHSIENITLDSNIISGIESLVTTNRKYSYEDFEIIDRRILIR